MLLFKPLNVGVWGARLIVLTISLALKSIVSKSVGRKLQVLKRSGGGRRQGGHYSTMLLLLVHTQRVK